MGFGDDPSTNASLILWKEMNVEKVNEYFDQNFTNYRLENDEFV